MDDTVLPDIFDNLFYRFKNESHIIKNIQFICWRSIVSSLIGDRWLKYKAQKKKATAAVLTLNTVKAMYKAMFQLS